MTTDRASSRPVRATADDLATVSPVLAAAFPRATHKSLGTLAHHARVNRMERDEVLLRQGESTGVVMVLRGHVALMRLTADGREVLARVIQSGELVGLVSALRGGTTTVQAVALSDGAVASWRVVDFQRVAAADAGLAQDLLEGTLQAVVDLSARIDTLLYQGAERRVARALHQYRELVFGEPAVLQTHRLPALVGTSREMLSRALRRLEARRILERTRSGIRLLDAVALEAVALDGTSVGRRPGTSSSRAPTRTARVTEPGRYEASS
jgi:CRP-like cAMP-binding protein